MRRLLPPAYRLTGRSIQDSGWGELLEPLANLLEGPFAKAPRNSHEKLFGRVGANGPEYYLQSQKLVLFNAIVSIAVASALLSEADAAIHPVLYAALLPPVLTIALSPTTFLMYSWATSVEALKDKSALLNVLRSQREQGFRAKLKTLSRLCDCFEMVVQGRCVIEQQVSRPPSWEQLQEGSPDALLNLLTVFDLTDVDLDGSISREECRSIARTLGYVLSDTDVAAFFECAQHQAAAGDDHDQAASGGDHGHDLIFREFASAVLSLSGNLSLEEIEGRSKRLFGLFDVDRGGVVTVDEMELRLERMGFDTAGTEQLFVDITGLPQNTISSDEFASYLRRTGL